MTWQIRSLRVTIFPPPDSDTWTLPSWQSLLRGEPENRLTPGPGIKLEEGEFERGRIAIQRQHTVPVRADIRYTGIAPDPESDVIPSLGTWEEVIATFAPVRAAVLNENLTISRIAIGVEHFQPVTDVDEAFRVLSERIDPERFELTNVRDFTYQINRRSTSEVVPGLLLNRLAKWYVGMWRVTRINPTSGTLLPEGEGIVGPSLTTDVNSDGDRQSPLPIDHLSELLSELERETEHLALRGDRRP
jgi:hypothetical protein